MSVLQSLLLGVLQGVAEFLPISSSGHLALAQTLMGLREVPVLYDVLLHVSTLLVVLIVFRKRVAAILGSLWRGLRGRRRPEDRENLRLALWILLATVATAAVGLLLSRFEGVLLGRPDLISILFLVTAAILIATAFFRGERGYLELGVAGALLIGLAQGVGVLPGVSRSGITIAAVLFLGLQREKAGEMAFLLAIPAILGALVLQLRQAGELGAAVAPLPLAAGLLASLVVGLAALLLLLRLVRRGRLYLFSLYLIPAGVAGLLLL
jgi:undecaprenyl-diphosphatase